MLKLYIAYSGTNGKITSVTNLPGAIKVALAGLVELIVMGMVGVSVGVIKLLEAVRVA